MSDLPEVSIVLPVHDAEARLEALVRGLRARLREGDFSFEIWLAEHGSTDRTARVAGQLSAEFVEVNSFCVGPISLGTAQRRGIAAARGRYVVCDAPARGDADFIGRAVDRLRHAHADLVVGGATRHHEPGRAGRAYQQILRWGVGFEDATLLGGLVAFRRALVAPIAERCVVAGEVFTSELVIRCHRQGLRVTDLAVRGGPPNAPAPWQLPRAVGDLVRLRRALRG